MTVDIFLSIILSIIVGIIFGCTLFVLPRDNTIIHGPNSNDFKLKIFKKNDKCYIFKPKMYLCP